MWTNRPVSIAPSDEEQLKAAEDALTYAHSAAYWSGFVAKNGPYQLQAKFSRIGEAITQALRAEGF